MSDSKKSQGDDGNKRNLPSRMSSTEKGCKSHGKKPTSSEATGASVETKPTTLHSTSFSQLLEGVVFVLSGFVNPERATLRSQALNMGAEYRPDWSSDCTLLVCAYSNTPKFRQVEADCGTIVKKEWIIECYSQKKLVEIDSYLMHAGKPWRKNNISNESVRDEKEKAKQKTSTPTKSDKKLERRSHSKPTASATSKTRRSDSTKDQFSLSKVKEWAVDDLNRTISWLESQEEKPEPSEIKQIAAEGIIICLQDAIDSLEQNQDMRQIAEQWNVVPRAVEELVKLVDAGNDSAVISKDDLCRQAKAFKQIYEAEFKSLHDESETKTKRVKTQESARSYKGKGSSTSGDAGGYDSDETIEMTEEEIDLAYNAVASTLCK